MFVFVLLAGLFSETVGSTIELKAAFEWNWDLTNNCGPKPQGPQYPAPPSDSNGTYATAGNCDIVTNQTYVYNYKCETTCQMEPTKTIELICNCFFKVGPVKQVIPCKWQYEDDEVCPEVPESAQYDWECDPRLETCKEGQYPGAVTTASTATMNPFQWNPFQNYGNGTNPFIAGGFSGQPIIISPVMNQNIGDITAVGGPDSNFHHDQPSGTSTGNGTDHTHSYPTNTNTAESQEKDLIIMETKEKLRSTKNLLKAAEKDQNREREQTQLLLDAAEDAFERERLAFVRERDGLVKMYESALSAKDSARQDIINQLDNMHELLKDHQDHADSRMGEPTRTVTMEHDLPTGYENDITDTASVAAQRSGWKSSQNDRKNNRNVKTRNFEKPNAKKSVREIVPMTDSSDYEIEDIESIKAEIIDRHVYQANSAEIVESEQPKINHRLQGAARE